MYVRVSHSSQAYDAIPGSMQIVGGLSGDPLCSGRLSSYIKKTGASFKNYITYLKTLRDSYSGVFSVASQLHDFRGLCIGFVELLTKKISYC